MAIMPVPTCCKLHAHNYTCIPIFLGRRGTPDPTGQLVLHLQIHTCGWLRLVDINLKSILGFIWLLLSTLKSEYI